MTALSNRLTIRSAEADDLTRVVEIYNAGIAERIATFETSPRTIEDISSWVNDGQPFIVAIDTEQVMSQRSGHRYRASFAVGLAAFLRDGVRLQDRLARAAIS